MFFFRASVMKAAIAEHLPALAAGLDRIDEAAARGDEARVLGGGVPHAAVDLHRPRRDGEGQAHRRRSRATSAGTTSGAGRSPGRWREKDAAGNALPDGHRARSTRGTTSCATSRRPRRADRRKRSAGRSSGVTTSSSSRPTTRCWSCRASARRTCAPWSTRSPSAARPAGSAARSPGTTGDVRQAAARLRLPRGAGAVPEAPRHGKGAANVRTLGRPTRMSSRPTRVSSRPTRTSSRPTTVSLRPTRRSRRPTPASSRPTRRSRRPTQGSSRPACRSRATDEAVTTTDAGVVAAGVPVRATDEAVTTTDAGVIATGVRSE